MNAPIFLKRFFGFLTISLLAAGCHKNEPAPPTAFTSTKAPEIVSAEKTTFDQVTAKLNKGGNLFVYLSTEQTLHGLSNHIAAASNFIANLPAIPSAGRENVNHALAAVNYLAANSGVTQIAGLGMSSIARESGFYYSKLVVYHYPGQNDGLIWSLFGAAPHSLDVDLLPESTALAAFSDFDLKTAWTNVNHLLSGAEIPGVTQALAQTPTQFHQVTGLGLDDVLNSLGGEYGFIFTLDQHKKVTLPIPGHPLEMPSPGLAIVIKVNNDLIFDRVDKALSSNQMIAAMMTRVDDPDLKMRTVNVPLPIPVDLRPSIARAGDFLIIASSDILVHDMLAAKSGQKKGFKSTDEFKKLSQGIPGEGNNFTLMTGAFSRALGQVQQQFVPKDEDQNPNPALQNLLNANTNSSSYSVGVNGSEGWEGFANGNHNVLGMAVPAVAGIGAAAAIAIPKYVMVHEAEHKKDEKNVP
jgi:hypothetical protein